MKKQENSAFSARWVWLFAALPLAAHAAFLLFAYVGSARGYADGELFEALYLKNFAVAAPQLADSLFDPSPLAGAMLRPFAQASSVHYLLSELFHHADPDDIARAFAAFCLLAAPALFYFTLFFLRLGSRGIAAGMILFVVYFWLGFPAMAFAAGSPQVVLSLSLAALAAAAAHNMVSGGPARTPLVAFAFAAAMLSHRSALLAAGVPILCLLFVFFRRDPRACLKVVAACVVAAAFNSHWIAAAFVSSGAQPFIPDAALWRIDDASLFAKEFFSSQKVFGDRLFPSTVFNGGYILTALKPLLLALMITGMFDRSVARRRTKEFLTPVLVSLAFLGYLGSMINPLAGTAPTLYAAALDFYLIAAAAEPAQKLASRFAAISGPFRLLVKDVFVLLCVGAAVLAASNAYILSASISRAPGYRDLDPLINRIEGYGGILYVSSFGGSSAKADVREMFYIANKSRRHLAAAEVVEIGGEICFVEPRAARRGDTGARDDSPQKYLSERGVRWIITRTADEAELLVRMCPDVVKHEESGGHILLEHTPGDVASGKKRVSP